MKPLVEVVQFVPVLTLAAGFVIAGEIDLSVAAGRFALAAVLAVLIVAGLAWKKVQQNAFLVGADLWLLVGAVSFNVPIGPVEDAMVRAGGGGIFVGALLAGLFYTATQPEGYLGVVSGKTRALSVLLLVLTAAAAVWAIAHPDSIRLGAALPFIGINVLRRVMGRLASR